MVPTPAIAVPNLDIVAGTSALAKDPADGPMHIPTAVVREMISRWYDVIVTVLVDY